MGAAPVHGHLQVLRPNSTPSEVRGGLLARLTVTYSGGRPVESLLPLQGASARGWAVDRATGLWGRTAVWAVCSLCELSHAGCGRWHAERTVHHALCQLKDLSKA